MRKWKYSLTQRIIVIGFTTIFIPVQKDNLNNFKYDNLTFQIAKLNMSSGGIQVHLKDFLLFF